MEKTETNEGSYKWVMLALLWLTYFLLHGTRQIFNASYVQIQEDFGLSDAKMGWVRTAFLLSYALVVPFAGLAADFFRRKWVIVIGTCVFSAGVFCSGFSGMLCADWLSGFAFMLVMYGLVNGVGQCMIPGACSSLIAQYHVETRSRALSIYQSALYVGIVLCSVVAGWLSQLGPGGWRHAFWVSGGLGIVWLVAVCAFLRDTPQQAANIASSIKWRHLKVACLALWSRPTGVLLTFAFGMLVFGSNCFRTYMPKFLQLSADKGGFALETASAGFHSVTWFYIGSFLGIAAGAWVSDRFSESRPKIRLWVMFAGLALSAPAMCGMVCMPSLALSCLMMFLFGVGGGFFDANLYAGLFDVVVPRFRAAAMGMYLFGSFLIGCWGTTACGWVSDHSSTRLAIAVFSSTYAIGAVAVLVAIAFFFKRDFIGAQQ